MMTAQDPWDKPRRNPWPAVLACLILLAAVSLSFGLGAMLATARKEDKPPQAVTTSSAPEPSAAPAETPEPVRYRDDIVSEGRLLPYDLQELMQLLADTGHTVFVSEQEAPPGVACIWERPFTRTLDRNKSNQFKVTEKLFYLPPRRL